MGKRFLLSAIAVSVIAGSAYAGELVAKNGVTTEVNASKEWAKVTSSPDVNISLGKFIFKPTNIKYSPLDNPVVNITFDGAADTKIASNHTIYICEVNASNSSAAPKDQKAILKYVSNYKNKLSFEQLNDMKLANGKYYGFFVDVNESNCSQNYHYADSNLLAVTLNKDNPANVGMNLVVAAGDSQNPQDSASISDIVTIKQQFCATVALKFYQNIDTADFLTFESTSYTCGSGNCPGNTAKDTDEVKITIVSDDGSCIDNNYSVTKLASAKVKITADNAIPVKEVTGYKLATGNDSTTKLSSASVKNTDNKVFEYDATDDSTITIAADSNNTTKLAIKVNGTDTISPVNFTADLTIEPKNDTTMKETLLTGADAGSWGYNGVAKTIPYAVSSSDTRTAVRVANTGAKDARVYWTCWDDNGNKVSYLEVKAADTKKTTIPANGAAAWLMKDVLAAAQAKNPDFAPNGKMTCKVLATKTGSVSVVPIMTINGARDRVIPTN